MWILETRLLEMPFSKNSHFNIGPFPRGIRFVFKQSPIFASNLKWTNSFEYVNNGPTNNSNKEYLGKKIYHLWRCSHIKHERLNRSASAWGQFLQVRFSQKGSKLVLKVTSENFKNKWLEDRCLAESHFWHPQGLH